MNDLTAADMYLLITQLIEKLIINQAHINAKVDLLGKALDAQTAAQNAENTNDVAAADLYGALKTAADLKTLGAFTAAL